MHNNFDEFVDASGLRCPLPILRAKKVLATMASGQILKVISTDANSVLDFTVFAEKTGNTLLDKVEKKDQFIIFLKKR